MNLHMKREKMTYSRIGRALLIACLLMLVGASSLFASNTKTTVQSGKTSQTSAPAKAGKTVPPEILKKLQAIAAERAAKAKPAANMSAPLSTKASTKALISKAADSKARSYFSGFNTPPVTITQVGDWGGTGPRIGATAMGDFDQDGKMDVIVFSKGGFYMIMKGDGAGNFTPQTSQMILTSINGQPYDRMITRVDVVDLNKDGYPDLVLHAQTTLTGIYDEVAVFLNQKNGTFGMGATIPVGTSDSSLITPNGITTASGMDDFAVYDLNGDGYPDIVMLAHGTGSTATQTNVIVETILNNGDGTFTPSKIVETDGTIPGAGTIEFGNAAVVHKTNGQLYLSFAASTDSDRIYTYPISATGSVDLSKVFTTDLQTTTQEDNGVLKFADVNKDGIDDLIFSGNYYGNYGAVYVALGKSDGTFGTPSIAVSDDWGEPTAEIDPVDLNNDGNIDLLIPGALITEVALGNGDGTFQTPRNLYEDGYGYAGLDLLNYSTWAPLVRPMCYDWDGDGNIDVLYPDAYLPEMSLLRGNGDGTFAAIKTPANPAQNIGLYGVYGVADFNGDGYQDIIAYNGGYKIGMNDGKGNFTFFPVSYDPLSVLPVPGDFNRDGKDDFVLLSVDQTPAIHLWLNTSNGDGTFTSKDEGPLADYTEIDNVIVKDVNSDGYPDVVLFGVQGRYNGFSTLLNDRNGGFTSTPFVNVTGMYTTVTAFAVADIRGNGLADVIVDYGSYYDTSSTLAVYLNGGDGNFSKSAPITYPNFTLPVSKIVAKDLNGDGYPDLVMAVQYYYEDAYDVGPWFYDPYSGVYVALNDKTGNFPNITPLTTAFAPFDIAVEDFNGDGVYDIAASNDENNYMMWIDYYYNWLSSNENSNLGVNFFRGIGDGTFADPVAYNVMPYQPTLEPIDLYGNGAKSLYVDSYWLGAVLLENNGGTSVAVTATPASVNVGDMVTVKAVVVGRVNGTGTPTGTVTFSQDGAVVGSETVDATGTATYSTDNLVAGTHSFTAAYAGDTTFPANSISNTASVTVASVTPAFTLATSGSALSVTSGSTASATLSFTSNAGFNGTIALSCSGAPSNASCAFSSPTVTLAANSTATSTLTITTSTQTARNNAPSQFGGAATALALLLMPIFIRKRRKFLSLMLLAVLAVGGFVTGCGSSAKSTTTPAGTYNITVTATPSVSSASAKVATFVVTVK